jgi:FAD/FMN-containing dehydrogenase
MTRTVADWETLQGAIGGAVVVPDAPDYDSVRMPAMTRFEAVRPACVVLCSSSDDVAAAIAFARRGGLETRVRSGGHSVAGRSSTAGLVIDVTPMSSVSVADGVATVGAGARLGSLYDALDEHGLTIPAGCGPYVGIGGLTLGGGIGILGRKHGLTCEHLVGADVVLADGRVVHCDEHHDAELFWALRGAGGGNFGVVVSFVFRTVPAPATTVFRLTWPFVHAAAFVEGFGLSRSLRKSRRAAISSRSRSSSVGRAIANDRRAAGEPFSAVRPRRIARSDVHALGRRLQPRPRRCHRFSPPQ